MMARSGGRPAAGSAAGGRPPDWTPRRPLLLGLLLSVLAHAPLLLLRRTPPAVLREPAEVVVRLAPLQDRSWLERARRQASRPPAVSHRHARRPPAPAVAPPPPPLTVEATPVAPVESPASAPQPADTLVAADVPPASAPFAGPAGGEAPAPAPAASADSAGASAPPDAGVPPPDLLAALPRQGEVDYRVTKGSGEWRSGRGTLRWRVDQDHYRLDLDAHAEGLPALVFWSGIHWSSEGRITAAGLQPDVFMKSAQDGVRFDWNAHTLTFLPSGTVRPLPDGSLDLLSVFFQFALRPPADDSMDFPVTNGDKIDRYAFEMTERTPLKLEIGEVDTVHISRVHQLKENGFEIWLAQDRNFLPVQMRLYHARLGVMNLYATGIRLDGLHGRLQEH
ncbi:MAG: DUF3108 domain-containing protein [Pseudomonadota bacterium]|nr:DUF3108 domain-containing protein [Pseudomonadota bacterium]